MLYYTVADGDGEVGADVTPYALCPEEGLCLQKPRSPFD